jgi:hypothetical protein
MIYVALNAEAGQAYLSATMFENDSPLSVLFPVALHDGNIPAILNVVLQGSELGELPLQFNWSYSAFA